MSGSHRSHMATRLLLAVTASSVLIAGALFAQGPPPGQRGGGPPRQQKPTRKQVLVWCDTTGGGAYHDSVSHAMAVIEKMGRDTGLFDAYLRTDSQLITKQKISVRANGRDWANNKNLDYFDAIFFYGLREIPLTPQQKADLIAFVKEDGKGLVAAHTAINAFQEYPPFAEMMGAGFDNHPWNMAEAQVVVEDPSFPGMEGFAPVATLREEWYQVKDFSRENVRVLMSLDASKVDLKNPNVHRTDNDFPQAWVKMAGKGRIYFSAIGHAPETWDRPEVQKMWLEAIKWALGMTNPDISPRPMPKK